MPVFQAVGIMVCGGLAIFATILAFEIAGNIYGGIKGAYRLRAIHMRFGARSLVLPHWQTVRLGLKAWAGHRYRDGFGTYWRIGRLIVPVDGRDSLSRSK